MLAARHATEAWLIADDVLRNTTERQVPQAQAVAAVTSAIMAQLDGERETVIKLAGEAVHVADEVSTRQWRQWARSLQWWAGEGIEEPELPGPLLQPYFQMLLAEDPRMETDRALALLTEALELCRSTGERFCEAEILRVRAGRQNRIGRADRAEDDYDEAVAIARHQGAGMLELRGADRLGAPRGCTGSCPSRARRVHGRRRSRRSEPEPRRSPKGHRVDMSVTDWSDDFLDSLRTQADPPADDIVAGIFAGTADATSAFRTLVVQQHEVSDPVLSAFLNGRDDPPAWVDPELVAAGQERFARWGSHVFTALYAAALPRPMPVGAVSRCSA